MSTPAENFEFSAESAESYGYNESLGSYDWGRPPQRPARLLSIPGSVSTATLNTPRGPATLNLPTPAASLAQYRGLESTVNDHTIRLNALQTSINRLSSELTARRRDQQSQMSTSLLFSLMSQRKIRDDLAGHTHDQSGAAVLPAGTARSSNGLSSMLPLLLMLQPGLLGGSSSNSQDANGFSPLLLMLLLFR